MGQSEDDQQPPCHNRFGRRWGGAAGFAWNTCEEEEVENQTDKYWEYTLEDENQERYFCGKPISED